MQVVVVVATHVVVVVVVVQHVVVAQHDVVVSFFADAGRLYQVIVQVPSFFWETFFEVRIPRAWRDLARNCDWTHTFLANPQICSYKCQRPWI